MLSCDIITFYITDLVRGCIQAHVYIETPLSVACTCRVHAVPVHCDVIMNKIQVALVTLPAFTTPCTVLLALTSVFLVVMETHSHKNNNQLLTQLLCNRESGC